MHQIADKFQGSTLVGLFHSFSPASRAVILFAIPFTLVDAVHYYTAGSALIFSLPLVIVIYLLCGALAARIDHQANQDLSRLPGAGRSAALRLWLTSTVINALVSVLLGFASLGLTLVGGSIYLCLSAPFQAVGSSLVGWLGGWLYQQSVLRTKTE